MEMELSTLIRVRYGETDRMGVVNNANYLNWFEIGRTEFCRQLGKSYADWEKEGLFLPVVEARCRYKNPAFYDDRIRIFTSLTGLKKFSLEFSYRLVKEGSSRPVAFGWTKHAMVDGSGKLIKGENPFLDWIKIKVKDFVEVS